MSSMFDLSGKVAIVTGGNGGIGLAMAKGMAKQGANIVVAARDAGKSETAVNELQGLGVKAIAVAVDVTSNESVAALIEATRSQFGRIDILVNNAGMNIRKAVHELALDEWHLVLNTNLTSAFMTSKAAYPSMLEAGGGKIINIGSVMSIMSASFSPVYSATKGGIVQLTKSMAIAWAKSNIQVNAVLPGWIETDLTARAKTDVPGLNESVLGRSPTGRWGRPGDFEGIAAFLASSASDFVTATAIPVDGGYLAVG